jgi:hypothetical protein
VSGPQASLFARALAGGASPSAGAPVVCPPESIEYASRAALLADATQATGATGYAPSYAAPTMVRQWSGTAWLVVLEQWDGVTAGQQVADLATTPGVENGAIWFTDTGTLYLYDGVAWNLSAEQPDGVPLTATDFASLPTTAEDGAVYTITAETGITGLAVRYSTSATAWLVTSATCSYAILSAAQWASTAGTWYDAGGIVVRTADGAQVRDTTYGRSLRWRVDSTPAKSAFWPSDVYEWIAEVGTPIVGNSATPTGWTASGTPTTDGTRVSLASTSAGTNSTDLRLVMAGLTNAGNAYFCGLFQCTAKTVTGSADATTFAQVSDGTRTFRVAEQAGTSIGAVAGGWTAVGFLEITQQSSLRTPFTTEAFVEVLKIGNGAACRVNGGQWHDVSGANCEASANTRFLFSAYAAGFGGTSAATLTMRHVQVARS